jgi:LysM repeat protein
MNPATSTEVTEPGSQTPTGPISPELAPPAETAPASLTQAPVEPAPSVPLTSGPVHMPPVEAAAPAPQTIHVVKITDSYKKIAHRYHITVAELKEANHIHNDILHTGQKLIIPSEKNVAADSAPMSTSSLAAAPTGPVPSDPAPTASLVSSSSTVAATGLHHHLYTVVKGDTLIRIAHRFKTTAKALMAENGITDPTKLAIGKKLRIPSEESRSATNGAPASTQPSPAQAKQGTPTAQLANYVH